ncbi:MAG TPA: efflux RND transporter periplasmic adaptor subunit [Bacteroidales bacterium]|nr:efflux RND transporter periplasmic adaptor subunit [Bacteroidales bacterium]
MKTIRNLFALALIPAMFACSGNKQDSDQNKTVERLEPVEVMPLEMKDISRDVEYTANLVAFEELHLAPAAPGRIESILVEVGDRVRKGQTVVRMDQTQLRQAEIQLATLETDFRRLDTLRKLGSIAQQQFDQLRTQLEVLRKNVDFLRENTQLRAPFDGVVSGKYFENGEMYTGAPSAAGKPAVISLVQMNRLKALLPVSEKYLPLVKRNMEAIVTSDVFEGEIFSGRITNIYPTVDPSSRTFQIEVGIDNRSEKLRPGMFARVTLALDRDQAFLLPSTAVLKLQGSNDRYLFVEDNGLARRVPVNIVKRYNDMVEVTGETLKPGNRVIISGQARLLDGAKVKVLNQ